MRLITDIMGISYMLGILIYIICIAASAGWVKLWLHICRNGSGLIRNLVMIVLSFGVTYIAAVIVFLPVDDTYSYSNICAQGLLLVMFLQFFAPACLIALILSVCRAIMKKRTGDWYAEKN